MHEILGIFKAGKTYHAYLRGETWPKNDLWTFPLFQFGIFTHSAHRNTAAFGKYLPAVAEYQESLSGPVPWSPANTDCFESQGSTETSNLFPYYSHWRQQHLSKHLDLCLHLSVLFISLWTGHQTRRHTISVGFNWPFLQLSWQLPGNQLSSASPGLQKWALGQRSGHIHALPTAREAALHMLATDPHTGCRADVSWTCCTLCTNRLIFTSAIVVTHPVFLRAFSVAQQMF